MGNHKSLNQCKDGSMSSVEYRLYIIDSTSCAHCSLCNDIMPGFFENGCDIIIKQWALERNVSRINYALAQCPEQVLELCLTKTKK